MFSGVVKLMNGENVVVCEEYNSVKERKGILIKWQIEIKEYSLYQLQIYPMPYVIKKGKPVKKYFDNKEPLVRPKAIYTNIPTYNYGV